MILMVIIHNTVAV